jgi:rubrerythrin
MQPTPISWKRLPQGDCRRAIARIAHIANINTWMGGTSAAIKAGRALRMGLPHSIEMNNAVTETYALSNGKPHPSYTLYQCNECGTIHLGIEDATECCKE